MALEVEALFVVTVLRAWVSAHGSGGNDASGWRRLFALTEMPSEAASAFGSFMTIVRSAMRRPLDVRCCPCPQVGQDEEAMLRIIAAVQRDDRLGALEDLSDWLAPEGLMSALAAAGTLGATLRLHDVSLAGTSATVLVRDESTSGVGLPVLH